MEKNSFVEKNKPEEEKQSDESMDFHEFIDALPDENPVTAAGKRQKVKRPRVPDAYQGININFCKNPGCENFGTPIESTSTRGRYAKNRYTVVGYGKGVPSGRCNACGESFPIKSNQGVFEEAWRFSQSTFGEPTCPEFGCDNHRVGISTPKAYYLFGKTKLGSQRYRCRVCDKIFSVKPAGLNPIERQLQSDKNRMIFAMLVNKAPLRRICEMADVHPEVLYRRIDFFHEQAQAFLAERESKLPDMEIKRLYVGVDRQEYAINWSQREDKRNTVITAVASADNLTGYVFGMDPNFDPEADPDWVGRMAWDIGDHEAPLPHRRFARLWLQSDYDERVKQAVKVKPSGSFVSSISNRYDQAMTRSDIEALEFMDQFQKLPDNGMLVHAEYSLYGHFHHLNRLFKGAEKVRFFLDQDSGMRAACLGIFADRIIDRTTDVFYVRIAKEMTVDEKRKCLRESKNHFKEIAEANPQLKPREVELLMLRNQVQAARQIGPWKDRWVMHPLPSIDEAKKASCFLTDRGDYDDDHLAWLHHKASLRAVDSWFNRTRRRNNLLERPISPASNSGRTWYGYSPYRCDQVAKMLTLLRISHNFIWASPSSKDTPAMRLGLAKAPLDYKDIIYFR